MTSPGGTGGPTPREDELIYDWNHHGGSHETPRQVELDDETLRDGLQSPSVTDPSIDDKLRILHLMEALGIDTANLGLPAAGPRAEAGTRHQTNHAFG